MQVAHFIDFEFQIRPSIIRRRASVSMCGGVPFEWISDVQTRDFNEFKQKIVISFNAVLSCETCENHRGPGSNSDAAIFERPLKENDLKITRFELTEKKKNIVYTSMTTRNRRVTSYIHYTLAAGHWTDRQQTIG